MESSQDRLEYLSTFGEIVTINGSPVQGLFDLESAQIDIGDAVIDSSSPQVVVRSADLDGVVEGGRVERGNQVYRVSSIRPDGTGMTTLVLHDASR